MAMDSTRDDIPSTGLDAGQLVSSRGEQAGPRTRTRTITITITITLTITPEEAEPGALGSARWSPTCGGVPSVKCPRNCVLPDTVRFGYDRPVEPCPSHGDRDEPFVSRKELALYRKLLDLGTVDALGPFLEDALALVVEIVGARRGYIELGSDADGTGATQFWIARGFSDEDVREQIKKALSRSVIAEALATGRTVATASALDDERFKTSRSVRRNRIEAVLCAPIGSSPPIGVVYLQDRTEAGPFSEADQRHVELFARHVAPYADRLLAKEAQKEEDDPTRPLRATLAVGRLVGRSPALARVLKDVKLVAPRSVCVLLTGPTGTGKTDLARVIHDNSPRSRGPFVALNCANLSDTLAGSELFGHEKGAFTGADRRSAGKIATASGGTLFLDEIGELPLDAQAKLLTFLDSKEYFAVGSDKLSRADVRLIAATNVDLEAAVADKRFRRDLYFRLSGIPIRVPSLAERREDIPDLMAHFLARVCEQEGLATLRFSPGATRAAEAAEWPGNIRELARAVEAAALRASADEVLTVERQHLFPDDVAAEAGAPRGRPTLQAATHAFQARFVQEVLDEVGWNVKEAAARLDIVRSHVYNLIKAHGLRKKVP